MYLFERFENAELANFEATDRFLYNYQWKYAFERT